jgi:hypothetical protein
VVVELAEAPFEERREARQQGPGDELGEVLERVEQVQVARQRLHAELEQGAGGEGV